MNKRKIPKPTFSLSYAILINISLAEIIPCIGVVPESSFADKIVQGM